MESLTLTLTHKLAEEASKLLASFHKPVVDLDAVPEHVTVAYVYDNAAARKVSRALAASTSPQAADTRFPWLYVMGDLLPATYAATNDWLNESWNPRVVLPYLGKNTRDRLGLSVKYGPNAEYHRLLQDGILPGDHTFHIHVLPAAVKPASFMKPFVGRFDPDHPPAGYHHYLREGDWLDWNGQFEVSFKVTGSHHLGEMTAVLRMPGSYLGLDSNQPTHAVLCGGRHVCDEELPERTHLTLDADGVVFGLRQVLV